MVGLLIFGFLVALMALTMANPTQRGYTFANGSTAEPPTIEALSAGCLGIVTREEAPKSEIGWVTNYSEAAWHAIPPTSGNFAKESYVGPPVVTMRNAAGFTPATATTMLYRGWVVVWYQPTIPPNEVAAAAATVESLPAGEKIILAPWASATKPTWNTQHGWWITGWNKVQPCSLFSAEVLQQFRKAVPPDSAPGYGIPLNSAGPRAEVYANRS